MGTTPRESHMLRQIRLPSPKINGFPHVAFAGMIQPRSGIHLLKTTKHLLLRILVWKDTRGQDLIEYALMAGFVAVAAGAIMPGVATSISKIFSKVGCVMSTAASQGS
jgi:pilus assembly protein Flp/PilA